MGMKKKMLSATLCAVMVGSLAAPAFTVQAADDTLVYWSMISLFPCALEQEVIIIARNKKKVCLFIYNYFF